MKFIELLYAFELEAANLDKPLTDKISSLDILYWLNQGVNKFIKTRYNGNNISKTSFEQDEKRARDLINLLVTTPITIGATVPEGSGTKYRIAYPNKLMFVLDESCSIKHLNKVIDTEIFECTLDNYKYRMTNSLTDYHFRNNYARPLRLRTKEGADIICDLDYTLNSYNITYLREPSTITLDKPMEQYTEFPEYAQPEIVKLAVQMYIENTSNQRYLSINNEVAQME